MLISRPPSTLKVLVGQAWSYQLGVATDFEGDNILASVQLRNAEGIINFNDKSLTLWIDEGATNLQT